MHLGTAFALQCWTSRVLESVRKQEAGQQLSKTMSACLQFQAGSSKLYDRKDMVFLVGMLKNSVDQSLTLEYLIHLVPD